MAALRLAAFEERSLEDVEMRMSVPSIQCGVQEKRIVHLREVVDVPDTR